MVPALQARALTRVRDYVSAEDVGALSELVFSHRLELAPGVDAWRGDPRAASPSRSSGSRARR